MNVYQKLPGPIATRSAGRFTVIARVCEYCINRDALPTPKWPVKPVPSTRKVCDLGSRCRWRSEKEEMLALR